MTMRKYKSEDLKKKKGIFWKNEFSIDQNEEETNKTLFWSKKLRITSDKAFKNIETNEVVNVFNMNIKSILSTYFNFYPHKSVSCNDK